MINGANFSKNTNFTDIAFLYICIAYIIINKVILSQELKVERRLLNNSWTMDQVTLVILPLGLAADSVQGEAFRHHLLPLPTEDQ